VSFVPSNQNADWARLVATGVNQRINGYPFPSLGEAPTAPQAGYTYYDTTLNTIRFWDGTQWNDVPALPSDPGADRILFWDDSAGAFAWLSLHGNLEVSGTTLKPKHRGALVKKAADQTAANYTASAAVAWDAEDYDTDGFHDNAINNTRLTVPAGVGKVRLAARIRNASMTADTWISASISKNGSVAYTGSAGMTTQGGLTVPTVSVSTPVISVASNDYFEVLFQTESDTSITVSADTSWFAIEVIE
jgi:hypothetical protein